MSWKVTPVPRPKQAVPRAGGAKWMQAGLYLLVLAGCVLVWMLEYDIPKIPYALLGAAIGAALAIAVYMLPRRPALWLAGGGALAGSIALYALLDRVVLGASYASALIYSRFTEVFHRYYYPADPPHSLSGLNAFGVFLVFGAILLAALLGLAVLGARSFWLCFAVCIPFFWFAYAKDGMPPVLPTLMLFGGWCALLLKGTAGRLRPKSSALMQLTAFVLCLAVMGGFLGVFALTGYQKSDGVVAARTKLERVRTSLEDAVRSGNADALLGDIGIGYGSGTVGSRTVTRVNLAKSGQLGFGSGNALTVTGLVPGMGTQYLRGFSCDVYTGTSWEQSSEQGYPLGEDGFQPLTFDPYYAETPGELQQGVGSYAPGSNSEYSAYYFNTMPWLWPVTVEYTGTPRYIHTPYYLSGVEDEASAFMRDAYLRPIGDGTWFTVYQNQTGNPSWVLSQPSYPSPAASVGYSGFSDVYYSSTTVDVDELLAMMIEAEEQDEPTDEYTPWWENILSRDTQTAEELAEYRAYIETQCTQLPTGLGDELREFAAWFGLYPAESDADWHTLAYLTGQLLRGFGTYTLSPGRMPAGNDFVTFFLRESQAGYCVHYASAGTALLRALGVPARYVEGYVTGTEEMDDNGAITVPKKNSHAWVEVWQPDYGWLPLEVTPGGAHTAHPEDEATASSSQPEASTSLPEESAPASESTPSPSSSASQSSAGSSSVGAAGGGSRGIGAGPFIAVACGLAALALLLALPGFVRRRRFRKFYWDDANKAVLAMYRYLERLEAFGYPPSAEMHRLAEKARFSQHKLEPAERRQVLAELQTARARLMETLPPFRRLWLYLRGL